MSDQKLRELERRWRETKSVEDEAAYLRERVRVGDLTQERLELAAYCGHQAARALLDHNEPCGLGAPEDYQASLRLLRDEGRISPAEVEPSIGWLGGLRHWGLIAEFTGLAELIGQVINCLTPEEIEIGSRVVDLVRDWARSRSPAASEAAARLTQGRGWGESAPPAATLNAEWLARHSILWLSYATKNPQRGYEAAAAAAALSLLSNSALAVVKLRMTHFALSGWVEHGTLR